MHQNTKRGFPSQCSDAKPKLSPYLLRTSHTPVTVTRCGCPTDVPRMSHGCPTDVPRMSHGCPTDVPRMSHGCPTDVPRMSHGCPTDVPRMSHGCPTDVPRMSHGCPTDVPRMSHGTLPDCYPSGIPCGIPSRILLRDSINTLKAASHLGLCEFMGFHTRFFTRFGENLWLAATAIL